MSNQIDIKIEGSKLTPEKFLEAVKSFFELVEGVAGNISTTPINWTIEVEHGSAIVRVREITPTPEGEKAVKTICYGVRSLRSGVKTIPPGFTKKEVIAAKTLATLNDGTSIQSIFLKNGSEPEEIPQSIATTADLILSGESSTAFGSIEGRIDSMSDIQTFICSITDPIYHRQITCYFQNNDIAEEAYRGFRKRVMASGFICYAREGHPTSIVVDSIRIFPDESELPTIEEVQALFK
jgi:hypothetical protein